ncbi:MAG: glycosyltransferase [Thiobacillus sp.]|nr:glycosyltransferase [Thiobacillus sp.]
MLLVEAAALARQRGLPVKLLFAGSGELTDSLKQRANELDVPVHFTGFLNQTEMWKAYVPADAFVLPSTHGETWGLVTNEAMLFGLPVIVSDQVGSGPDLVIDDETGYVFGGGAEGLADAMARLLQNRDRAPAMAAAGRKLVLEKYSMPVATAGLRAALKAVSSEQ